LSPAVVQRPIDIDVSAACRWVCCMACQRAGLCGGVGQPVPHGVWCTAERCW
jgi:hypothetical protein